MKIQLKKQEAENDKRVAEASMNMDLDKARMEFNADKELYQMQQQVTKQDQVRKMKQAEFETTELELKNAIEL